MQTIRILAIAPYEGMADSIMEAANEWNNIEMTVKTGDLNAGKEITMEHVHKNYDVILSRGGTAALIRSSVELPVVDISISDYDILRAIKMSENYTGKFAIAGFPGITSYAQKLCDLLQYDIDIMTFTSEEQAVSCLRSAQKNGCSLVLCDMTGFRAAKKLKLNSILITSGKESIRNAIQEAVKLVQSSLYVHKQKELFQNLLTCDDRDFLIYDPAGSLWFSSLSEDDMNLSLMNFVQTYLKAFLKVSGQSVERQIRNKNFRLSNYHLYHAQQKYTAIVITQKEALFTEQDTCLIIRNKSDLIDADSMNYYSNSSYMRKTATMLEQYAKNRFPVLILGEIGTGKDKAASQLYENGPFANAPFYTINCESMNERKWNQIINSENSPLNTLHSTIYIKNPGALSQSQCEKLISYLESTNLVKRSRILFSLVENSKDFPQTDAIRDYLENHLSCLTLRIPPLRKHTDDIPNIAALYLHHLNLSLGKQIIGFEAEAMEEMTAFLWPKNLDQLQRILKELIIICPGPYISAAQVRQILDQETAVSTDKISGSLDLSLTLDEINYQIVQSVLADEKGNKEKTARRLGISRSTLWRMLKNKSL